MVETTDANNTLQTKCDLFSLTLGYLQKANITKLFIHEMLLASGFPCSLWHFMTDSSPVIVASSHLHLGNNASWPSAGC